MRIYRLRWPIDRENSHASKGIRPILKQLRTLAGFLFFVASGSRREAKNRISRKIKNVAEVSKVQLKIQNNSRRLKTSAENLNLQPNVGRSAGKFETAAED